MHREDLSPYGNDRHRLCVGWLDQEHAFAQGEVAPDFLSRLLYLCSKSKKTRGFHLCDLCPQPTSVKEFLFAGRTVSLGSGEVCVRGRNWRTYVAPDLIYHYVLDHGYKPPEEFINAVLRPRSRVLSLDFLAFAVCLSGLFALGFFLAGYTTTGILFLLPPVALTLVSVGLAIAISLKMKYSPPHEKPDLTP